MDVNLEMIEAEAKLTERENGDLIVENVIELGAYSDNIGTLLRESAAMYPDKDFLLQRAGDGWDGITFAEMLTKVNQVSKGLLALELEPDAPIAILSNNSIEMAIIQFAAMQIGHPAVPISFAYSVRSQTGDLIKHILDTSDAPLLVMSNADIHMPKLSRWENGDRLLYAFTNSEKHEGVRDFADLMTGDGALNAEGEKRFEQVSADTCAKIQFTSGSTNLPKGVEVTHGMMTSNQVSIHQCWPFLDSNEVMIDWLPWNHTFGGNFVLNMALYHGATMYIDNGNPTPAGIQNTIRNIIDVRPTVYFGVPASYAALYNQMKTNDELRSALLNRLKFFFVAAAALDQATFNGLRAMGQAEAGRDIPFFSAWGTTETAPCCTIVYWVADDIRVIGLPNPGSTLKLVSTGTPNRYEILASGANITKGYYQNRAATQKAFDEDGFYRSGDAVAFLDPDIPNAGIIFSGRIGEDFKLTSGVWVRNATVRGSINTLGKPYILEVVLAAPNKPYLCALVVPNTAALRGKFKNEAAQNNDDAAFLNSPKVIDLIRDIFRQHNVDESGSSKRIIRFAILHEAPAFDRGETTDKGYINQSAVLRNHAELVEKCFEEEATSPVYSV